MSSALGSKIAKGKAGAVEFYPPAAHGRPSAPKITIKRPGGGDLPDAAVVDVAMTLDGVDTTVAVEPKQGDTVLTLASEVGVTVGRYYVVDSDGRREGVRVIALDTAGKIATLANGLRVDHKISATFKGVRCGYTWTALNAASLDRNYVVRLEWTEQGGTTHYTSALAHVVHWVWHLYTTEQDVLEDWPDAIINGFLRSKAGGVSGFLSSASDEIALKLRSRGFAEDQFIGTEWFKPWHVASTRRLLVRAAYAHRSEELVPLMEFWDGVVEAEFERIFDNMPPFDADNDGVLDAGEEDVRERAGDYLPRSWSQANPDGIDSDDFHPVHVKVGIGAGRSDY